MSKVYGPVAELMAILGVDNAQFKQKLEESSVLFDEFGNKIGSATQQQAFAFRELGALYETLSAQQRQWTSTVIRGMEEATEATLRFKRAQEIPTPGGGGGSASNTYGALGIRMGTGGISPFLRISEGMKGLGGLIEPLFPVILAGAFVDILYHEVEAVSKLTDEWTGFGVAAKKAWQEAFEGAEKSRIRGPEIMAEWEKARATAAKGAPLTRSEETGIDRREEARLKNQQTEATEQLKKMDSQIALIQGMGPADRRIYEYVRWAKGEQSLEELQKNRKETENSIVAIAEKRGAIERRILEDVDKKAQTEKLHDRVHELPYGLPWFFGLNNPATRWPSLPVPATSSAITGSPVMVGSSAISHPALAGGRSTAMVPQASPGSSGVTVNIRFDGIPADIQRFMRDYAEPRMVEDLKNNTGGITDKVVRILKNMGVR